MSKRIGAFDRMALLTQLDVSYGSALLQQPLRKVVGTNGVPVNLQPFPDRGQPVYLWAASAEGADVAVHDIKVIVDDEQAPTGWKKVPRDLSAGSAKQKSYICYKTGNATAEHRPIANIAILGVAESAGSYTSARDFENAAARMLGSLAGVYGLLPARPRRSYLSLGCVLASESYVSRVVCPITDLGLVHSPAVLPDFAGVLACCALGALRSCAPLRRRQCRRWRPRARPYACHAHFPHPLAEPGYEVLDRPFNSEGVSYRLAYLHSSPDASAVSAADAAWLDGLGVGDSVDAMSTFDRTWRVAKLLSLDEAGKTVHVSYKGWGTKFDEDIPHTHKRLARLGTHTAGKDTRGSKKQGAAFRVDWDVLAALERKIDMLMAGDFPAEEKDTFCKGELPEYVLEVMSSKYEDEGSGTDANGNTVTYSAEELRDRINQFNMKVIGLCVDYIKQYSSPMPPEALQHIQRYFLMDPQCNFLYEKYGHINRTHASAGQYAGQVAAFPANGAVASKYWVANINSFWQHGGMEALIERFKQHSDAARAAAASASSPTGAPSPSSSSSPSTSQLIPSPTTGAAAAVPAWADPNAGVEACILIKGVCMGRWCFTSWWGETYFARWRDAVFDRLLTLTEAQLKKAGQRDIEEVRENLLDAGKLQIERFGGGIDGTVTKSIVYGRDVVEASPALQQMAVDDVEPVSNAFDRHALDFAVRSLRFEALAMRVKAINDINLVVKPVIQEHNYNANSNARGNTFDTKGSVWMYNSNNKSKTATFSAAGLRQYLTSHRVLDLVLGDATRSSDSGGHQPTFVPVHLQVLTRLATQGGLLEFLASGVGSDATASNLAGDTPPGTDAPAPPPQPAPGLTSHHIHLLWSIYQREAGQEDMQHAVLDVLVSVAKYLSPALHDQLYGYYSALPRSSYDEEMVRAVATLTRAAIFAQSNSRASKKTAVSKSLKKPPAVVFELDDVDDDNSITGGEDADEPTVEDGGVEDGAAAAPPTSSNTYGMRQLWEACISGGGPADSSSSSSSATAGPPLSVVTAAQASFLLLLQAVDADGSIIRSYLHQAASAVVEGRATYSHIIMIDRLLQALATDLRQARQGRSIVAEATAAQAARAEEANAFVLQLQEQYHICEALVLDLQRYKALAIAAARRKGMAVNAPSGLVAAASAEDQLSGAAPSLSRTNSGVAAAPAIVRVASSGLGAMQLQGPALVRTPSSNSAAGGGSAASAPQITSGKALVLVGRHSHTSNVVARLSLLHKLGSRCHRSSTPTDADDDAAAPSSAASSAFRLTADHVDTLWTALVEGSITADEPETFFTWLHGAVAGIGGSSDGGSSGKLIGKKGRNSRDRTVSTSSDHDASAASSSEPLIEAAEVSAIFDRCFCGPTPRMDVATIGKAGYRCFAGMLRAVNTTPTHDDGHAPEAAAQDQLPRLVRHDDGSVATRDIAHLSGLQALWDIALRCDDEGVASEACQQIVELHARLDMPNGDGDGHGAGEGHAAVDNSTRRGVWRGFVARCVAILRSSVARAGADRSTASSSSSMPSFASTRTLCRTVRLLSDFLQEVNLQKEALGQPVKNPVTGVVYFPEDGGIPLPTTGPWAGLRVQVIDQPIVLLPITFRPNYGNPSYGKDGGVMKVRLLVDCIGDIRCRVGEYMRLSPVSTIVFLLHPPPEPLWLNDDTEVITGQLNKLQVEEAADLRAGHVKLVQCPSVLKKRRDQDTRMKDACRRIAASTGVDAAELYREYLRCKQAHLDTYDVPSDLLANTKQYFDTLFSLLSLNDASLTASTWSLIVGLPVSDNLRHDIVAMRGTEGAGLFGAGDGSADDGTGYGSMLQYLCDRAEEAGLQLNQVPLEEADALHLPLPAPAEQLPWADILGGSSPLRLLYALQMVDQVLSILCESADEKMAEDAPGRKTTKARSDVDDSAFTASLSGALPRPTATGLAEVTSPWGRAFVATGGLAYLHHLVMTVPLSQLLSPGDSNELLRSCASHLIAIYARFMVGPSYGLRTFTYQDETSGEVRELFTVNRVKLAVRMLEWLSFATTLDLPRAAATAGDAASTSSARPRVSIPSSPPRSTHPKGHGLQLEVPSPDRGGAAAARSSPGRKGILGSSSSPTPSPGRKQKKDGNGNASAGASPHQLLVGNDGSNGADGKQSEDMQKAGATAGGSSSADATDGTTSSSSSSSSTASTLVRHVLDVLAACVVGTDLPAYTNILTWLKTMHQYGAQPVPTDVSRLQVHPDVLRAIYSFSAGPAMIVTSLVAPQDGALRSRVAAAYFSLLRLVTAAAVPTPSHANPSVSLTSFLLVSLLSSIRNCYAFPFSCAHYFELTLILMGRWTEEDEAALAAGGSAPDVKPAVSVKPAKPLPIDESRLISTLCTMINRHPIVEVGSDQHDVKDEVLQGLLRVSTAVLHGRPHLKALARSTAAGGLDLITTVFDDCLFALPTDNVDGGGSGGSQAPSDAFLTVLGGRLPKCKQPDTRQAALQLLTELATDCPENAVLLAHKLLPHHDASAAAEAAALASPVARGGTSSQQQDVDGGGGAGSALVTSPRGGSSAVDGVAGQAIGPRAPASTNSSKSSLLIPARNSTGYVGLKNLGCICYMNSTLQQFFMNAPFRRGVLSHVETSTSDAERADSIMYQLQRQFAYLQESAKMYFTPKGICFAIKDWEGRPTDFFEQKDVPEFLTKLFTDLETQLQGTSLASLAKDVFGGKQVQELIADDPRGSDKARLYAARDEDFYFLQVRVKGHKDLAEALAAYVAGETVDYKWTLPDDDGSSKKEGGGGGPGAAAGGAASSSAGGAAPSAGGSGAGASKPKLKEETVKTTKRVSLSTMGDHLMVHLNRFDFDLVRMEQVKLNDRFEFPVQLDMWPYTIHARQEAEAGAAAAGAAGKDGAQQQQEVDEAAAAGVAGAEPTASTVGNDGVAGPSPSSSAFDRSQYQYELVGVVIHMGTAIGGHYYSYIRERDASAGPQAGDRWFEFNDAQVSPWSGEDRLDADCFGGSEWVRGDSTGGSSAYWNNSNTGSNGFERVKTANAFCLFYERKRSRGAAGAELSIADGPRANVTPQLPPAATAAPTTVITVSAPPSSSVAGPAPATVRLPDDALHCFISKLKAAYGASGASGSSEAIRRAVRVPVPTDLLQMIHKENVDFARMQYIHQPQYAACIFALVRSYAASFDQQQQQPLQPMVPYPWGGIVSARDAATQGGPGFAVIRLAISYMMHTLGSGGAVADAAASAAGSEGAAAASGTPSEWYAAISTFFKHNHVAAASMLQSLIWGGDGIRKHLLESTSSPASRRHLAHLISAAIEVLWPVESAGPPTTAAPRVPEASPTSRPASPGRLVLSAIDILMDLLPGIHKHWARFDSYFNILKTFAAQGEACRRYMIDRRVIARLVDVVSVGSSILPRVNEETPSVVIAREKQPLVGNTMTGDDDSVYSYKDRRAAASSSSPASALTSPMAAMSLSGTEKDTRPTCGIDKASPNNETHSLFVLLRRLVCSCAPLAGTSTTGYPSPLQEGPVVPMHDTDRRMVTCAYFVRAHFGFLMYSVAPLPSIASELMLPIFIHLMWGQMPPPIAPVAAAQSSPLSSDGGSSTPSAGQSDSRLSRCSPQFPGPAFDTFKGADACVEGWGDWDGQAQQQQQQHPVNLDDIDDDARFVSTGTTSADQSTTISSSLTSIMVGTIRQFLREDTIEQLPCGWSMAVRVLQSFDGDDPSVQMARTAFLLHHMVSEMRIQSRYYRETEKAIELLARWGRDNRYVASWCAADMSRLEWMEVWLNVHKQPPAANAGANSSHFNAGQAPPPEASLIRLMKPSGSRNQYNYYQPALPPRDNELSLNIMRLRRGLRPSHYVLDEDDDKRTLEGRNVTLLVPATNSNNQQQGQGSGGGMKSVPGTVVAVEYVPPVSSYSGSGSYVMRVQLRDNPQQIVSHPLREHVYNYRIEPLPGQEPGDLRQWFMDDDARKKLQQPAQQQNLAGAGTGGGVAGQVAAGRHGGGHSAHAAAATADAVEDLDDAGGGDDDDGDGQASSIDSADAGADDGTDEDADVWNSRPGPVRHRGGPPQAPPATAARHSSSSTTASSSAHSQGSRRGIAAPPPPPQSQQQQQFQQPQQSRVTPRNLLVSRNEDIVEEGDEDEEDLYSFDANSHNRQQQPVLYQPMRQQLHSAVAHGPARQLGQPVARPAAVLSERTRQQHAAVEHQQQRGFGVDLGGYDNLGGVDDARRRPLLHGDDDEEEGNVEDEDGDEVDDATTQLETNDSDGDRFDLHDGDADTVTFDTPGLPHPHDIEAMDDFDDLMNESRDSDLGMQAAVAASLALAVPAAAAAARTITPTAAATAPIAYVPPSTMRGAVPTAGPAPATMSFANVGAPPTFSIGTAALPANAQPAPPPAASNSPGQSPATKARKASSRHS